MSYSSAIIIDDLWDDKLCDGVHSEFTVIVKYGIWNTIEIKFR